MIPSAVEALGMPGARLSFEERVTVSDLVREIRETCLREMNRGGFRHTTRRKLSSNVIAEVCVLARRLGWECGAQVNMAPSPIDSRQLHVESVMFSFGPTSEAYNEADATNTNNGGN